jgi:hypothetical protein
MMARDDLTELQGLADGVALSMFNTMHAVQRAADAQAAGGAGAGGPMPVESAEELVRRVEERVAAFDAAVDRMAWIDKTEEQQLGEIEALDATNRALGEQMHERAAGAEALLEQHAATLRAIADDRLVTRDIGQ